MHFTHYAFDPIFRDKFPSYKLQLLLTKSNKVSMNYYHANLINLLENNGKN